MTGENSPMDNCEFLVGTFTQSYVHPNFIIERDGERRIYSDVEYVRCTCINVLNHEARESSLNVKLRILFDGRDFIGSLIKRYGLSDCSSYFNRIESRIADFQAMNKIVTGYSPTNADLRLTYRQAALYLSYLDEFVMPTEKKDWKYVAIKFGLASGKKLYEYYNGKFLTQEDRTTGKNAQRDLKVVAYLLRDDPNAIKKVNKDISGFDD